MPWITSLSRKFAGICLLTIGSSLSAVTGLDAVGQLKTMNAAAPAGFAFVQLDNGVQIAVNGVTKNVLFYDGNVVRVNANLGRTHTAQPSLAVVAQPVAVAFAVQDSPSALTIASEKVRIVVDKKTGALAFFGADGKELTRERTESPYEIKEVTISGAPTYEVRQTFALAPNESLYGLGQYNRPYMD